MSKFISYKMTHDTGFAPNPFNGHLTLATCKPTIRRTKACGDWVAGFASKTLADASARAGVKIPIGGLLYLMNVGEVMKLQDYFNDSRFEQKKPIKGSGNLIEQCGDNIYDTDGFGGYRQLANDSHDASLGTINHDTGGVNVLIADTFYYFGRNCFIPKGGWESIGITLSKGRTFYCSEADLQNIRHFLLQNGYEPGIHGKPCLWDDKENVDSNCSSCSNQKNDKAS
jgi:hypothetical protein